MAVKIKRTKEWVNYLNYKWVYTTSHVIDIKICNYSFISELQELFMKCSSLGSSLLINLGDVGTTYNSYQIHTNICILNQFLSTLVHKYMLHITIMLELSSLMDSILKLYKKGSTKKMSYLIVDREKICRLLDETEDFAKAISCSGL